MGTRRRAEISSPLPESGTRPSYARCRKKPLETQEDADELAKLLHKLDLKKKRRDRGHVQSYFCLTCHAWHVGHDPNWLWQKDHPNQKRKPRASDL